MLRLVVATFGYRAATLIEQLPNGGLDEVVSVGDRAEEGLETGSVDRLPLTVGRRSLGLLVLEGDRPSLEPSERRILDAFSNQLALLLERDRALRAAISLRNALRDGGTALTSAPGQASADASGW